MNILLVDDEKDSRLAVARFLRKFGHQVVECADGEEALKAFANDYFPFVLSDIKMPRMSGLELLAALSQYREQTDVVLFTGHGDMDSAIAALRAGAYDYLLKPINIEELAIITERIAQQRALKIENQALKEHFDQTVQAATEETRQELARLKEIVAQSMGIGEIGIFSSAMQQIFLQAQKYHKDRSIPVLIQGETGTGKELIARTIHFGEQLNPEPFVALNCAALSPSLFESELFGYEGGTFTGGLTKGQKGKFDLAQGGTLFLDEIGELPLELQSKLLRVIQEKEFYRVGGLKKVTVDLRIICAANVDLQKQVEKGKFRQDLYYRLKVGSLYLPPLRERQEDILPLAYLFLQKFSRQKQKRFAKISLEAEEVLLKYTWPGNVRELSNAMEWAVFMYDEIELKLQHLPKVISDTAAEIASSNQANCCNPQSFSLPLEGFSLEEHINQIVLKALDLHQGNKTEAANYLGMSRRSFCYRLDKIQK